MTAPDALDALGVSARTLRGCSLAEVLAAAELQTRIDRKYLVPPDAFTPLVSCLGRSHRVLEIGGLRTFRYESVYFDTATLEAYLGAARGRRRRFKVRTRTYLDSDACMLEVKREGGRAQTIKERVDHPVAARTVLDDRGRRFVAERVALSRGSADTLEPTLTTTYRRMTLVDLDSGSRVTCDAGLELTDPVGRSATMADHVLVETKSAGSAGAADRLLWRAGIRPVRISKYAVGMAALRPELPANRWHRVLRDHFGCRQESLAV
jgi:hypothetical protein